MGVTLEIFRVRIGQFQSNRKQYKNAYKTEKYSTEYTPLNISIFKKRIIVPTVLRIILLNFTKFCKC